MLFNRIKIFFVRSSSLLFAWWLFGFLAYFPVIDGLRVSTAVLIGGVCVLCAFGLWFSTVNFAARYRFSKMFLLLPSIFIFPYISYLISPFFLIISLIAIALAIHILFFNGVRVERLKRRI